MAAGINTQVAEGLKISDRVRKLRNDVKDISPRVDTERLKFMLDVYKEMEGEPIIMKRARLFEKHLTEKTIYIDDNLIVGTQTKYQAGAMPTPEVSCRWMRKMTSGVRSHLGYVGVTDEDMRLIEESVDYWADKCVYTRAQKAFALAHDGKIDPIKFDKAGSFLDYNAGIPQGTISPDMPKVLKMGLKGIIEEVEKKLADLPLTSLAMMEKRYFYNAILICLNAMIKFAERYSVLAGEMAEKEADPKRKEELERISAICAWVPANPARNFHEAIQTVWFLTVGCWCEVQPVSICPGRFPLYMYPFYKKDKEDGKITDEDVLNLLGFLFIKYLEGTYFVSRIQHEINSGQTAHIFTVGGLTEEGHDATNELDFLLLETQRQLRCIQPSFQLLYHEKLPRELVYKAVDCIRETGLGQPAFFSQDVSVKRLLAYNSGKISLKEAQAVGHLGCVQTAIPGKTFGLWTGAINMAKQLELALNNGKDPLTGFQIGPQTGEVGSFQSYDDLQNAVWKQMEYSVSVLREFDEVNRIMEAEIYPTPFHSSVTDDCIEKGTDITAGGARYSAIGEEVVGNIDLANSLAAIKKLVFEEKRIAIEQLKDALAANFEGNGYGDIHRMCLEAPKYGNDDDYVDLIAREGYDRAYDAIIKTPILFDQPPLPYAFSLTTHFHLGKLTGALPSGRKSSIALTDASVSAMPGTDRNGPTALILSAVKAIDTIKYGQNHFNLKFHPSALEGKEGIAKFLALIKTYMDLGGSHIQFNCITSDQLKKAQLKPQEHRDLVVRVAGFSAFFVNLDEGVQDELIKRTELNFD